MPPFHLHPEVGLLVAVLAGAYEWALRRVGPDHVGPGEPVATTRQRVAYFLGVATIAVAAEWPVHDLAERFLFSVHMFQHLLLSLVTPGLMLVGAPPWLLRLLLRPRAVHAVARQVTRPFVALILFNAVIVITHWPAFVDLTLRSELFHFGAHAVLFLSALCMWWPVVSPLPEMPSLSYPARMVYLFLQSIVPTVPASFLTFGSTALYPRYATFSRIWGIDVLTDQRIAGLMMKILGGAILWGVMAVIFFRWFNQEQATEGWDALAWHRTEREISADLSRPRQTAGR
ncbi:MAG TPA: cytochrome c oxidase assembly protein [Actinomycetota bacterium]|nr:cytochrome c oxidase assembly protein [Actinomycetota bacterium]